MRVVYFLVLRRLLSVKVYKCFRVIEDKLFSMYCDYSYNRESLNVSPVGLYFAFSNLTDALLWSSSVYCKIAICECEAEFVCEAPKYIRSGYRGFSPSDYQKYWNNSSYKDAASITSFLNVIPDGSIFCNNITIGRVLYTREG